MMAPDAADTAAATVPLVVDLDGTLIRSDLLHESVLKLLQRRPHAIVVLPLWLAGGKARTKREIAQRVALDVKSLPYDESTIEWIRGERAKGRRLVLCTASDAGYATQVAEHLGLFDEVISSDGETNVSAHRKAARLVERFGDRGFDYAGNSSDDLHVWAKARRAILVGAPRNVAARARERFDVEREFTRPPAGWRTWFRALRLHQWLKNLLVFLPLLGAHRLFDVALLSKAAFAFVAFGLCASAVYVINDLMDLESDRAHPRKRNRPFASGALSAPSGILVSAVALCSSIVIAYVVSIPFLEWLVLYFVLTTAYTFFLKRHVLVDCITLAMLYTLRVLAGGAAVGLQASFWLLAFSMFVFLSLAFLKRYSELMVVSNEGKDKADGRGYLASDLPLVQTMGVAAGFTSVMVMALYINGDTVPMLYHTPEMLWIIVPILLYWVTRMWMQAHRGNMDDDPMLFALRDSYSLASMALIVGVMWLAS